MIKTFRDLEKKLSLAEFKLERTEKVKRTTAILLEETIEELEQKRRAVEAQNRELQIEAALERVRSQTMAMQKSDELFEVIKKIYDELQKLGFDALVADLMIFTEDKKGYDIWLSGRYGAEGPYRAGESFYKHPHHQGTMNAWVKGEQIRITELKGEMFTSYFEIVLNNITGLQNLSAEDKNKIFSLGQVVQTEVFTKHGCIRVGGAEKGTEAQLDIQKRFAKVFDQSYTRFLDLKKAEAQAREAQIELALERVRARTMAMHKSDELQEAANLLFHEVQALGVPAFTCGYNIWEKEEKICSAWMSSSDGLIQPSFSIPLTESPTFVRFYESRQKGEDFYIEEVEGEALAAHYRYMLTLPVFAEIIDGFLKAGFTLPAFQINHVVNFSKGNLIFITGQLVPEAWDIFKRFAAVFEQTYTRFLDLQKAEAQAKEAQIEVALEKVRSRSLAMHKTEELQEVVTVVFEKLQELGIVGTGGAIICTYIPNSKDVIHWIASPDFSFSESYKLPYFDHPVFIDTWASKDSEEYFFSKAYSSEEKNSFFEYLFEHSDYKRFPDEFKNWILSTKQFTLSAAWQKNSAIIIPSHTDISPSEKERELLKRFAKVFEQVYIRFMDLQKAEAQAREAQIEAGLERVRGRAMAMHNSDELNELLKTLFEELTRLDVRLATCMIWTCNPTTLDARVWIFHPVTREPNAYAIQYNGDPFYQELLRAWKARNPNWIYCLEGDVKIKWEKFLFSETEFSLLPEVVKDKMRRPDKVFFAASYYNYGTIQAAGLEPFSRQNIDLLQRFSKVFDLSYTRFRDLQKAEAQAREAKIELGLERVRTSAMVMRSSNELKELVKTLFIELTSLDINLHRCMIWIGDPVTFNARVWILNPETMQGESLALPYNEDPFYQELLSGWKERNPNWIYTLEGEQYKNWLNFLLNDTEFSHLPEVAKAEMLRLEKAIFWASNYNYGAIQVATREPFSEDNLAILRRFSKVFDQAYTRFLDLQKAEAQAREAKIEAALEKVRSRTMAMQRSDELAETAFVLFQQFKELNATPDRIFIGIVNEEEGSIEFWITGWGGSQVNDTFKGSIEEPVVFNKAYKAWKREQKSLTLEISGPDLSRYLDYLKGIGFPVNEQAYGEHLVNSFAFFTKGYIGFVGTSSVPTEAIQLLERFAGVFDLTYTRFLDLQKAEAQTREAKIEAVLERVRSRTMAMQKSDELTDVAGLLFEQVGTLGVKFWTAGFNVWSEDNNSYVDYITSPNGGFIKPYTVHTNRAEALRDISDARKSGVEFDVQYVEGEKIKQLYRALTGLGEKQFEIMLQDGVRFPSKQYEHFVFGSKVSLMFITYEPVPEAHDIFKRLGKVFEQTYTRFLDLQKAEAQAKEAQRQASLDRVRGEIASMRTTSDLERITPLIWKELTILNVPFIRCGVFIMEEEEEMVQTYLSTPEGKALAVFQLPFHSEGIIQDVVSHWRSKQPFTEHWNAATFSEWTKSLVDHGAIKSDEKYSTDKPPENLHLHFIPFLQGMMYVGNTEQLSEDDIKLVQSLADAFSTAYARYEDFNRLETANQQIEITLSDLKAAQAQLIQSEKMASLGELTAGIAHEIQNPLNFVNNFSEVNTELIAELKEEADKGNIEEVKAIASDIKENEEKINHHGKRADAIVKGMLQHSRASTGKKEPTDINALADEYLRLSYHGLRAKDKSFNADFKTNFDESIGKINVAPQDIGRVLLNLYNNAFYAVKPPNPLKGENYKPEVIVTIKKENDKVIIVVKDNGNGIPKKAVDKIFQPFFTTKPTGQGTGLGLSLSYDIIKAHGGELRVQSKEGEGAEFVIELPIK